MVSIIIPTYNAEKYLPTLLDMLQSQTLSYELIIIDSSSTDNTIEIAQNYTTNIISIPQHAFDHGGTRTIAAKAAKGDILVFLTQDALPVDTSSIKTLISSLENNKVAAVYGRQLPYEESNIFGKHLRLFNYPNTSYLRDKSDIQKYGMKTGFLSDSFAAYKRSALEDINWFKNGLIVGEDNYAGASLILKGYTLAYNANAKVFHSHSYTTLQEFQRYFDIGVFHTTESWIIETFGKAEGEGKKYIISEFRYILKHKKYLHIPLFFLRNAAKFLGYKLGKQYTKLPAYIISKLSMHTSWWSNIK